MFVISLLITRALDWIFSHADDLDAAVAAASSTTAATTTTGQGVVGSVGLALDDGEGLYTLTAIITHIGTRPQK